MQKYLWTGGVCAAVDTAAICSAGCVVFLKKTGPSLHVPTVAMVSTECQFQQFRMVPFHMIMLYQYYATSPDDAARSISLVNASPIAASIYPLLTTVHKFRSHAAPPQYFNECFRVNLTL
uniref:Uncharacterized protein n=1 Tax=Proboscia inermis TaxID=420281 RepID=A0A7S0GK81_9STRA|mmetsp:Transcript_51221/g.51627  ORF Transcript_51221/g.51627 Transcript_51221/m.51627 type:complete len:120 (+) Transcript_51221:618-977(+)